MEPDDVAKIFRWGADGASATRADIEADTTVIGEASMPRELRAKELPDAVETDERARVHRAVRARVEPDEQIVAQHALVLELPVASVSYGTGKGTVTVDFIGRRLLAPPSGDASPFRRRTMILNNAVLLFAIPAIVGFALDAWRPWCRSIQIAAIVGLLLVSALSLYMILRRKTLGRRVAPGWMVAAGLPIVVAGVLYVLARPDLGGVRAALRAGDLDRAENALAMLGHESDPELASTYADLRVAQLQRETDVDEATRLLLLVPTSHPGRGSAEARFDAVVLERAAQLRRDKRFDDIEAVLRKGSANLQNGSAAMELRTAATLDAGRACFDRRDWQCAYLNGGRAADAGVHAGRALQGDTILALRQHLNGLMEGASKSKDATERARDRGEAVRILELMQKLAPTVTQANELTLLRAQLVKDQAAAAKVREAAEAREQRRSEPERPRSAPAATRSCCRVCTSGCACGDSCISCSKTCRAGPGCAC